MKAYPAYKKIGFDFLDSLPVDWNVSKLKYLSSVNFSNVDKHSLEGEVPVRLCNYVDVYKNDFITPDMNFMQATATEVEIKKFTLQKGDVLITKDSESWEDIAVPAFVTANMDGVLCGYHLAQIRSSGIDGKFLFWALCSSTLNDQYKVEAHGITRYGLGKDSIQNSFIPIPSLPEQQAIADFLDRKTKQIDTLIAKKQRQIQLLQEQRAALINQAVTKGLNPSAPLKDSGVEWLGEIPSHWDVYSLKHLTKLKSGDGITSYEIKEDGPYAVFGGNGIRGYADNFTHEGEYALIGRQGALCGNINYAKGRFWASEHAVVAMPKKDYKLIWFGELLRTMNLNQYSMAAAQPGLSVERIENLKVPVPPIREQELIEEFINEQTSKIDSLVMATNRQIELWKEYRTALISEAVTGKMDVR